MGIVRSNFGARQFGPVRAGNVKARRVRQGEFAEGGEMGSKC